MIDGFKVSHTIQRSWKNMFYQKDVYKVHISSSKFSSFDRRHADQLNEVVYNTSKYMQPLIPGAEHNIMCEGILANPVYLVPIEVMLPCDTKLDRTTVICTLNDKDEKERIARKRNASIMMNNDHSIGDAIVKVLTSVIQHPNHLTYEWTCRNGWINLLKHCLKFVPLTNVFLTKAKKKQVKNLGQTVCNKENSTFKDVRHHREFLRVLNYHHDYSNVLITFLSVAEVYISQPYVKKLNNYPLNTYRGYIGQVDFVLCSHMPLATQTHDQCLPSQFRCRGGTCISELYRCDGEKDCELNEDEIDCPFSCLLDNEEKNSTVDCSYPLCKLPSCQCGMLFINIKNKGCRLPSYQIGLHLHQNEKQMKTHKCNDGSTIPYSKVDDLVPDCSSLLAEDEKEYQQLLKNTLAKESPQTCENKDYLPCVKGHSRCFPANKLCVLDYDKYGDVAFCRNGIHLQQCEYIGCPTHFKCPYLYCIPLHYVCDGIEHCPYGEDESFCNLPLSCPGMFRCKAGFCLSEDAICDGQTQCPDSDDEMFCNISECPDNCKCLRSSLDCSEANITLLPNSIGLQVIIASYNQIDITSRMFLIYHALVELYLDHNNISQLPHGKEGVFQKSNLLSIIDLSWNNIAFLGEDSFKGLDSLWRLVLTGNNLFLIGNRGFHGLSALMLLDISNLSVEKISVSAFLNLQIKHLDVSNNAIQVLHGKMFETLSSLEYLKVKNNNIAFHMSFTYLPLFDLLKYVEADEWNFCCIAKIITTCNAPTNKFSHCEDLLRNTALKVCMWMTSLSILFANGFVLVYRGTLLKQEGSVSAHNIMLLNLALADILMSVYLGGIAVADLWFQDVYAIQESFWRASPLCKILGFLQSVSVQLSLATVVSLSALHLYIVGYRKSIVGVNYKIILVFCAVLWLFLSLLSALPLIELEKTETGVCTLFSLGSSRYTGWYYTVVYIILNLICLIVFLAIAIKMMLVINASAQKVRKAGHVSGGLNRYRTFVLLVLQLVCILICWIPLEVVMMMSLAGGDVHPDIISWFSIFVLPFSSLTNPFIYTIRVAVTESKTTKPPRKWLK